MTRMTHDAEEEPIGGELCGSRTNFTSVDTIVCTALIEVQERMAIVFIGSDLFVLLSLISRVGFHVHRSRFMTYLCLRDVLTHTRMGETTVDAATSTVTKSSFLIRIMFFLCFIL
jgi:hypothetical protein